MKLTLEEWRRAKKISQEQMASWIGVHVNTYRAWEDNPGDIRLSKAILIADKLEIPLDDILFTRRYHEM